MGKYGVNGAGDPQDFDEITFKNDDLTSKPVVGYFDHRER
jgi:hypothetical protein